MDETGALSYLTDNISLYLLFGSLVIFGFLALKSKSIRGFQFQISIFIIIIIVAEITDHLIDIGVIVVPVIEQELGYYIHVGAMAFFALMLWLRFYYSKKSGKQLIEDIEE